jgi:hypothetical protein
VDNNGRRELTSSEVLLVVAALLVFLVPLFLLTVLPNVKAIQVVLGNGRVFIIWIALAILLGLYRKQFDEYFERRFGRSRRRKK